MKCATLNYYLFWWKALKLWDISHNCVHYGHWSQEGWTRQAHGHIYFGVQMSETTTKKASIMHIDNLIQKLPLQIILSK